MSKPGSTTRLDCKCLVMLHFRGPAGGPCEVSREELRSAGLVCLYSNDSFQQEMTRFSAPVQPWPESLKDEDLTHHVSTWASGAAQFWGYQGPLIESNMTSASLVLRRHKMFKGVTSLGAWIEILRNSSTTSPGRKKYRQISTAMDKWRLEDVARYWSNGVGQDGREVWRCSLRPPLCSMPLSTTMG